MKGRNNDIMGLYNIISNEQKNHINKEIKLILAQCRLGSTISTTLIRLNPDSEHLTTHKNVLSYVLKKRYYFSERITLMEQILTLEIFSDIIGYAVQIYRKKLIDLFVNNGITPKTYQIEKIID